MAINYLPNAINNGVCSNWEFINMRLTIDFSRWVLGHKWLFMFCLMIPHSYVMIYHHCKWKKMHTMFISGLCSHFSSYQLYKYNYKPLNPFSWCTNFPVKFSSSGLSWHGTCQIVKQLKSLPHHNWYSPAEKWGACQQVDSLAQNTEQTTWESQVNSYQYLKVIPKKMLLLVKLSIS